MEKLQLYDWPGNSTIDKNTVANISYPSSVAVLVFGMYLSAQPAYRPGKEIACQLSSLRL
jgi:hypothetical protein